MNNFNIVNKRKIFFSISGVLIVCGIISMMFVGLNFDIDYVGGTTMHFDIHKSIDDTDVENIGNIVLDVTGEEASSIAATGETGVIIKTHELESTVRDEVFERVKAQYSLTDEDRLMVDNVSPTVGNDLKRAAINSAIIAIILMLIYITIRFQFTMGVSAVLCLTHDVLAVLALYSFFQLPISTTFIAAILTIVGYSINATIVVFDRIRENMRLHRKIGYDGVVNTSIWQTMNRSINTSLTTLIVVLVLYFLGVPSIKNFAIPIIFGIILGTYSSVFLAGNFWLLLRKINKKSK